MAARSGSRAKLAGKWDSGACLNLFKIVNGKQSSKIEENASKVICREMLENELPLHQS